MRRREGAANTNIFDAEEGLAMYQHKIRLERIQSGLLKFGLTANQARIYMYLGKYGSKTAPEVCKALKIPRTETYFILKTLQNRGVITAEFSQPVKFASLPLEIAMLTLVRQEREKVNLLEKQESELVSLWNEVPSYAIETDETKQEKLQMLQGTPQIHSKIKEMIENAKSEMLIFCTEKDLARFYHSDFIDMLGNTLVDMKIVISPAKRIPDFIEKIDREKIRVMPHNENETQCFIIKDSTEIITFLRNANHPSHTTFAIWSDSQSLLDSMNMLFSFAWETSEICY